MRISTARLIETITWFIMVAYQNRQFVPSNHSFIKTKIILTNPLNYR